MKNLLSAEERTRLLDDPIPVWMHYDRQHKPQPAYIVLDAEREDGQAYADYSAEIGNAVTARYYHNRELHIGIPETSHGPDIVAFIDEHEAELRLLLESYETREWRGNIYGEWHKDAEAIVMQLEEAAWDEIHQVPVYDDIGELLAGFPPITADTDPEACAQEIWDTRDIGEWWPGFNLNELTEHIRIEVAELQEDE